MNGQSEKKVRVESLIRLTMDAIKASARTGDDGKPLVDPREVANALVSCMAFICACLRPSPTEVRKLSEEMAKHFKTEVRRMLANPDHEALGAATVVPRSVNEQRCAHCGLLLEHCSCYRKKKIDYET